MKKIYQTPACELVLIKAETMLAGSVEPENLGGNGGNEVGDDGDASRQRHRTVWDEEEDFE